MSNSAESSGSEMIVSPKCYLKLWMHALRYPHATVNGLLIAEKINKAGKTVNRFVDAIPLFHSGHGLSPMVEVALAEVSEYFRKHFNYVIGGYYQANEQFHEIPHPLPTVFAERIADKIWETNSDAVLLMMSSFDLASALDEHSKLSSPLHPYFCTDGKWKLKSNSVRSIQLEDSQLTLDLIQDFIFDKQHHLNLIDFDSHLETNASLDWRNPALERAISQFCAT